jgi:multidrug resistance efflux pump
MYDEDDLTEESEEIVLKRAKQAVEFARYRLEGTEIQSDRAIKQGIPRSQAQQEDSLARAQLAYQKAIRELNSARQRRDIEIRRKRDALKQQREKLAELKDERKQVVLTSPIDGISLHGPLRRGRLSDKPSVLKAGSKVTPQQVLITVVDPKKLHIRVDLDEKDLGVVAPGAECQVTAKGSAGEETIGTVKSVSLVPYAGTKYDCVVAYRPTETFAAVLPTMTCDLKFADTDDDAGDQEKPVQDNKAKQTKDQPEPKSPKPEKDSP